MNYFVQSKFKLILHFLLLINSSTFAANCNVPTSGDATVPSSCDFSGAQISVNGILKLTGGNQVANDEAALVKMTRIGFGRWFDMSDNDKAEFSYLHFSGGSWSDGCTFPRRESAACQKYPNNFDHGWGLFIRVRGNRGAITLNYCVIADMIATMGVIKTINTENEAQGIRGFHFVASYTAFRRNSNVDRLEYMTNQRLSGLYGSPLFEIEVNHEDRSVTIDHCTFDSNDSLSGGGILKIRLCSHISVTSDCQSESVQQIGTITNSIFSNNIINKAWHVEIFGGKDAIVKDTKFKNNKRSFYTRSGSKQICENADACRGDMEYSHGAALRFNEIQTALVERVEFDGNLNLPEDICSGNIINAVCFARGAALMVSNQAWTKGGVHFNTKVIDSTFKDNKAILGGAAIFIFTTNAQLWSHTVDIDEITTFVGNSAQDQMNNFGIISNFGSRSAHMINFLQCQPGKFNSLIFVL